MREYEISFLDGSTEIVSGDSFWHALNTAKEHVSERSFDRKGNGANKVIMYIKMVDDKTTNSPA